MNDWLDGWQEEEAKLKHMQLNMPQHATPMERSLFSVGQYELLTHDIKRNIQRHQPVECEGF